MGPRLYAAAVAELRIAVLGGVPAPLGGGGLERQAAETVSALRRAGHDAFRVGATDERRPFDLLHAFSAEADVCHVLSHWRHNPAPLVVSPVLVVPPGRERRELLAARIPSRSFAPHARAQVLRRADLVVAQTEHESGLLRRLGAREVALVPNGVTEVEPGPADPPFEPGSYALLVGTVGERKRQADALRALARRPTVVVGGFEGTPQEEERFRVLVHGTGAAWLGEVHDVPKVRGLMRDARALVHLSTAEGQALSIMEALRVGTPVIATPLPANRELAVRHPGHVHLLEDADGLGSLFDRIARPAGAPPQVPTWDDVAAELVTHYEALVRA